MTFSESIFANIARPYKHDEEKNRERFNLKIKCHIWKLRIGKKRGRRFLKINMFELNGTLNYSKKFCDTTLSWKFLKV